MPVYVCICPLPLFIPTYPTLKHTDTICINEFSYYIGIYRGFLNVNPVRHWGYKISKKLFSLQQSSPGQRTDVEADKYIAK